VVAPPGGVVVDFFAGGGSTGVAARRRGMRFLGCEIDASIAAVAREAIGAVELPRVQGASAAQLGLFGGDE
jgi:DNA modification methylase